MCGYAVDSNRSRKVGLAGEDCEVGKVMVLRDDNP